MLSVEFNKDGGGVASASQSIHPRKGALSMNLFMQFMANSYMVERVFTIGGGALASRYDVMNGSGGVIELVASAAPPKEIPTCVARRLCIQFILCTVRRQSCFLSKAAGAMAKLRPLLLL